MSRTPATDRTKAIRARTRAVRQAIAAVDYLASGNLSSRTKVCGRPNCRCAKDPSARHGPYNEWTRYEDGRLVHSILTPEQAGLVERGIANRREVEQLLATWQALCIPDYLSAIKTGGR